MFRFDEASNTLSNDGSPAPRLTHAKETLIFCGHRRRVNLAELARRMEIGIAGVSGGF